MATFEVEFTYTRRVTTLLEADNADEIHAFMKDNPDWDIVEDASEIIEDDDDDGIEYEVRQVSGVIANYGIHEGEIVEVEE